MNIPPSPKRSYDQYEKLEPEFNNAITNIEDKNHELAANALDQLCTQSVIMWPPPLPLQVSNLLKLKGDIENGRNQPPHGDFEQRLDEAHDYFKSEYKKDRNRSELKNETFVPEGKPDPPSFLD